MARRLSMIAGLLAVALVLGAMSVTWAVASFYGGRLMVRTTYRLTAVLGTLALIAGSVVLIRARKRG
jgi:hypothetical protein